MRGCVLGRARVYPLPLSPACFWQTQVAPARRGGAIKRSAFYRQLLRGSFFVLRFSFFVLCFSFCSYLQKSGKGLCLFVLAGCSSAMDSSCRNSLLLMTFRCVARPPLSSSSSGLASRPPLGIPRSVSPLSAPSKRSGDPPWRIGGRSRSARPVPWHSVEPKTWLPCPEPVEGPVPRSAIKSAIARRAAAEALATEDVKSALALATAEPARNLSRRGGSSTAPHFYQTPPLDV